ncbi:MAG: carbohydrate binding domain-containing protein [Treponema sp.]|nr:carbohydrate binding domain-containing protein [Treponema sp.]
MKKYLLTFILFCGFNLFAADFKSDFSPYPFIARAAKATSADCSYLNTPITENQRILKGDDGHLYINGKRVRIFGTNLSEFPAKEDAAYWADVLASQGINCVRFHHTDASWTNCFTRPNSSWTSFDFEESAFERFDLFFYELKKRGIYTNINLLTGRPIKANDENGLPPEFNSIEDWKDGHRYAFWNENARKEQRKYAERILTHKNPYTGLTYAEDPAVVFVEINNENSMLMSYFDGALYRFPEKLVDELEPLWNDFLKSKGLKYSTLKGKFNYSAKPGPNLLKDKKTHLEQYKGASVSLTEKENQVKIKINKRGEERWHIQYSFPGLSSQKEKLYTLSFKARASSPVNISVGMMMNHDPWRQIGFSENLNLTKKWETFSFTFTNLLDDDNARLLFGDMGDKKGVTIELSDFSLCEGGDLIVVEESENKKSFVKFPDLKTYKTLPYEYKILVTEFLRDIDSDYWRSMNKYLKEDLGVKALTFGTAVTCDSVTVMNDFDVIDTHAYWNHPSFPNKSWDSKDFYVKNLCLVKDKDGGTLTSLASRRVYGKVFSVTEYDHPYPNQFSSEMFPMYAVYASLQDWDCIYSFCYGLSQKNLSSAKIDGFFNQDTNPAKTAALPVAARIFREFRIKPFSQASSYQITSDSELKAITNTGSAWNVLPVENFDYNIEDSFSKRVGCFVNEEIKDITLPEDNDDFFEWNTSKGSFLYSNDEVFVSVTIPGAEAIAPQNVKSDFYFIPDQDFAVFAAVKLNPKKWFIFSSCWSGNLGEGLCEYGQKANNSRNPLLIRDEIKLTTKYSGAGQCALALTSSGHLEFNPSLKNISSPILYSLNADGSIKRKEKTFVLDEKAQTLWYELEL